MDGRSQKGQVRMGVGGKGMRGFERKVVVVRQRDLGWWEVGE